MNKTQLIDVLAARFEGNRKQASHALESVLDTITREVTKGEKVAITGFGSFEKRVRQARWVRNPQTGDRIKAKKTSVPKFTAGADLKNVVSGAKKLPKLATSTAKKAAAPAKRAATPAKKAAPTRTTTTAKTTTAKKATTKKATTKKAAPARAMASKSMTAKTTTAKRAPAKKTTTTAAKKAPAKKAAPAKKTATAKKSTAKKTARKA